jgi:hypothetical protein
MRIAIPEGSAEASKVGRDNDILTPGTRLHTPIAPLDELDQCRTPVENHADIPQRNAKLGSESTPVQRVIRAGRLVVDLHARTAAIGGQRLR